MGFLSYGYLKLTFAGIKVVYVKEWTKEAYEFEILTPMS